MTNKNKWGMTKEERDEFLQKLRTRTNPIELSDDEFVELERDPFEGGDDAENDY